MFIFAAAANCNTGAKIPDKNSDEAKMYQNKCGICHAVPHPRRHTKLQWEHTLSLMELRMKEKKMPELTEEENNLIRMYIAKNSRKR